ncbi:MAG: hypothetical protein HXS48_23925 [Theionarchaea archaeon]|nr:hypothetical protein [Theionarchaea archaeon]
MNDRGLTLYTQYLILASSLSMARRPTFGITAPVVRLTGGSVITTVFPLGDTTFMAGLPLTVTVSIYDPSFC